MAKIKQHVNKPKSNKNLWSGLGRPESDSGTGYSIPKLGIGTDSESDGNRYPKSSNFALFLTKRLNKS